MTDVRIYVGSDVIVNDLRTKGEIGQLLGRVYEIKTFTSGDIKYVSMKTDRGYEVVLKGIDIVEVKSIE